VTAKRICKQCSLCQRVIGTNSCLSTAAVNHCPGRGGQSQVTPVAQGTTGLAISMGKNCHTMLSLDAGLCPLSTHFQIMTIVTLFNKNDNRENINFCKPLIDFQKQTILTSLILSKTNTKTF